MSTRHQQIKGFAVSKDFNVERTVTGIPTGRTLARAWFTLKALPTDADPGVLQKVITPTAQPGIGQITDTGADTVGKLVFEFTGAQTGALTAGKRYYYDIQIELDNGTDSQFEDGIVRLHKPITVAT